MSEKRVGIIAEGKHDFPIIKSIIQAIFTDYRFVFTQIQPLESDLLGQTSNVTGFGWGGVYYACCNLESRIELQRAAGTEFDFLVIHCDADIMISTYKEANVTPREQDLELPCYDENQSMGENCGRVENVITNWLGGEVPQNVALCVPCINTDAWTAYILFSEERDRFSENIPKAELEQTLLGMPSDLRMVRMQAGRVRKRPEKYEQAATLLTKDFWGLICANYMQAEKLNKRLMYIDLARQLIT